MAHCPRCNTEVRPDERFCGNCGTQLEQPPRPNLDTPPAQPKRPLATGKETLVLPALDDPAEVPRAPVPPPPSRPAADATLGAPPGGHPTGGPGQAPPLQAGGFPGANVPPAQTSGKTGWKIIGIVAGVAALACGALSIGLILVLQQLGQRVEAVFPTISAGLSTAEAGPISTARPTTTPRPTATLRPTVAAAVSTALLDERFDTASGSAFQESEDTSSKYAFVQGAYAITVKQPRLISWASTANRYGDASIAVDLTIDGPQQSAAGLIFHYQDEKNFYIFKISGDGRYKLDLYEHDKLTTLVDWIEAAAIKSVGQVNALRVETVGDTIRLYANNTLLDEISDGTIARGKAAIAANTFEEPPVTVSFDNLIIQAIR